MTQNKSNEYSAQIRTAAAMIMLIFEQPTVAIDQELESATLADIQSEQSISIISDNLTD